MSTVKYVKYSNPRTEALFSEWPIGFNFRGKCEFKVEENIRGMRVSRRTTKKDGTWAKPKYTTYSSKWVIVDGDDGRTYLLSYSSAYGFITVTESNMQYQAATFVEGDPMFEECFALLESNS